MLQPLKNFEMLTLHATDGEIGHVEDFCFDDQRWVIWLMRYLLIGTSNFLGGRTVLAPVKIVGSVDWAAHHLRLDTIGPRIRYAPRVDGKQPLDRRSEEAAEHHYAIATADVRQRVLGSRRGR